jgi:hypothetical protein
LGGEFVEALGASGDEQHVVALSGEVASEGRFDTR